MGAVADKPIYAFSGFVLDVRKRVSIGADGALVDLPSRAFETHFLVASGNWSDLCRGTPSGGFDCQ